MCHAEGRGGKEERREAPIAIALYVRVHACLREKESEREKETKREREKERERKRERERESARERAR